jgi:hypothetical protein
MWRTQDRNLRKLQRSSRCNTHLQQAICTATRRWDARVAVATPMVATLLLRDEHVAAASHWTSVPLALARPAVRSIATNACCTPSGAGSTPGGASLHRCSDACARAAQRVEQLRSSPKAVRLEQTNKQTNKQTGLLPSITVEGSCHTRTNGLRLVAKATVQSAMFRQRCTTAHTARRCCANKCALRCVCCVASVARLDRCGVPRPSHSAQSRLLTSRQDHFGPFPLRPGLL